MYKRFVVQNIWGLSLKKYFVGDGESRYFPSNQQVNLKTRYPFTYEKIYVVSG